MSGFDSKKTEYMLLHMIADSGHPIGAGFLADMLTSEGEEAALAVSGDHSGFRRPDDGVAAGGET